MDDLPSDSEDEMAPVVEPSDSDDGMAPVVEPPDDALLDQLGVLDYGAGTCCLGMRTPFQKTAR